MNTNENESILCGMMLLDNSVIPNIYDTVKPSAFSNNNMRLIYETSHRLYNKGVGVDLITLTTELNGAINPAVVSSLTDITPSSSNWKYYAELVKTEYMARGLRNSIESAFNKLKGEIRPEIIKNVYSEIQGNLAGLASNTNACHIHNMRDLVEKEIKIIDSYISNKRGLLGIDTGFEELNSILNGLQPVYMILGARPSMGKTALLQKMAMNIAKNEPVIFIELEMSMQQLTERAISMNTNIPYRVLQSGIYSENALKRIINALENLTNLKNFIPIECFSRNLSDIENICRAQVRNNKVKAIFIDHVGLIKDDMSGEKNSFERARFISNELQKIQRELNVPLVVASQLGRGSETKKGDEDKVGLNSIRGSGAFEEDADICAFIIRDRADEDNFQRIETIIDIQKNRNGQVGKAHMVFYPDTVNFIDVPKTQAERTPEPPKMQKKPEPPKEQKTTKEEKHDLPGFDIF